VRLAILPVPAFANNAAFMGDDAADQRVGPGVAGAKPGQVEGTAHHQEVEVGREHERK